MITRQCFLIGTSEEASDENVIRYSFCDDVLGDSKLAESLYQGVLMFDGSRRHVKSLIFSNGTALRKTVILEGGFPRRIIRIEDESTEISSIFLFILSIILLL